MVYSYFKLSTYLYLRISIYICIQYISIFISNINIVEYTYLYNVYLDIIYIYTLIYIYTQKRILKQDNEGEDLRLLTFCLVTFTIGSTKRNLSEYVKCL